MNLQKLTLAVLLLCALRAYEATPLPDGFNGATWGVSPDSVRAALVLPNWQPDQSASSEFPPELGVAIYRGTTKIAGYPANVKCYFRDNRFFQATVTFSFDDLTNYDFNYNVYRSVNEYYTVIRSRTLVFVHDIYRLLGKKYGKKEPVFKGIDPLLIFVNLDKRVRQERWNFHYHPYDYYQKIVTTGYARWDFPKTRVIFSINISAPDKRFEYLLCAASLDMEREINARKDELRMRGL